MCGFFTAVIYILNEVVLFGFQIREEDKDPVYLYFERMMTCARIRAYERKKEGKKQQKDLYICNSENCTEKEHDPEHQNLKKEVCGMEKDTEKSEGKI
nr:MAX gene-associated protein-like [Pelodiscus sinensis]|eukprot:XP_014427917.1 MAX gene-associated protein-like [Pelodiscus sinensis]